MATLFGFVFLGHQLGSFLGVWLAGWLYDRYGSYDLVWWLSIALGLISALLHWPIDERAVARLRTQS
jgi:predicted MFS family arabinose efflux permease